MAEIINLRTVRKRANRRRTEERAAEARAVHRVSRVDRAFAGKYREKVRRDLDAHRMEEQFDEIAGR
jgi:hypothetical protein